VLPHDRTRTATIERLADPQADNLGALWDQEWSANLLKAALEKVRAHFSPTQCRESERMELSASPRAPRTRELEWIP